MPPRTRATARSSQAPDLTTASVTAVSVTALPAELVVAIASRIKCFPSAKAVHFMMRVCRQWKTILSAAGDEELWRPMLLGDFPRTAEVLLLSPRTKSSPTYRSMYRDHYNATNGPDHFVRDAKNTTKLADYIFTVQIFQGGDHAQSWSGRFEDEESGFSFELDTEAEWVQRLAHDFFAKGFDRDTSEWIPKIQEASGRFETAREENDLAVSVFVTRDLRTTCIYHETLNNIEDDMQDDGEPRRDAIMLFEPDVVPIKKGLFENARDVYRTGLEIRVNLFLQGWTLRRQGVAEVMGQIVFQEREPDWSDRDGINYSSYARDGIGEIVLSYLEHYMPPPSFRGISF